MKKLKKILVVGSALLMLTSGLAFAQPTNPSGNHFGTDWNPGNHYGWGDGGGDIPNNPPGGNDPPGCEGSDCDSQSAEGEFDISVFAIGGGLSADGVLIPNGAAGGIGASGAIAGGAAIGDFEEYERPIYDTIYVGPCGGGFMGLGYLNPYNYQSTLVGYETIALGDAGANIGVTAGGFTKTEAFTFNPGGFGIGVGSYTNNITVLGGHLDGWAWGDAYSAAAVAGIGGQASLDGSILFGSPLPIWDSHGMTLGVATQGSIGGFSAIGGAAGLGSYEADANILMFGTSYSASYRGIDFKPGSKTEYMGTDVGAYTTIITSKNAGGSAIGFGIVDGGFVAGGLVTAKSVQIANGGIASANAVGSYSGSGDLGCNYSGSAVGYARTSATTLNGYNGSVMTSSAGMQVSSTPAIGGNVPVGNGSY
jgi:hypothetical protein